CVGQEMAVRGDTPADPLPLAAMQSLDLAAFGDDITTSCGSAGGHDAFFEVVIATRSRLHVDTLDSDFHSVLAVFRGACAGRGEMQACLANSFGTGFPQWSDVVDPDTYCVVVDQFDGAETASHLVVHSSLELTP